MACIKHRGIAHENTMTDTGRWSRLCRAIYLNTDLVLEHRRAQYESFRSTLVLESHRQRLLERLTALVCFLRKQDLQHNSEHSNVTLSSSASFANRICNMRGSTSV